MAQTSQPNSSTEGQTSATTQVTYATIYRTEYPLIIEECFSAVDFNPTDKKQATEMLALFKSSIFKSFVKYLIATQQQDMKYLVENIMTEGVAERLKGRITGIGCVLHMLEQCNDTIKEAKRE